MGQTTTHWAAGDAGHVGQIRLEGAADVGLEATLVGTDDPDPLPLGTDSAAPWRQRMHLLLSRIMWAAVVSIS